ncbi:hypothetical protein K4F52_001168 [Lecanicillium sp. MT-2017a]|nr:hypothetical protein K4F52_001168 [Lecanicillium sp. MT-2017a]
MEPLLLPDGSLHEVLSQSLTEPEISSIDISIRLLDQYESDWVAWHEEDEAAEFVTYGDIDDETRPLGHSDTKYLASCCGQDRPIGRRGLKLHVTPSPGNEFVTIYDYMSTAHPWLVSLREDIIQAMIVVNPGPVVTHASVHATELMILL